MNPDLTGADFTGSEHQRDAGAGPTATGRVDPGRRDSIRHEAAEEVYPGERADQPVDTERSTAAETEAYRIRPEETRLPPKDETRGTERGRTAPDPAEPETGLHENR